jgi:molybdopterin synthase catalytic subunit
VGGDPLGPVRVEVTPDPIDIGALLASVEGSGEGAVVLFAGRVRDRTGDRSVTHIDYEAYGDMAEREMTGLADEARREHGAVRVALLHRTGRLRIGDVAVAIAVSAPHRPAAFDACRWLIDSVKERVPIWKKEHGADGSAWISEHP